MNQSKSTDASGGGEVYAILRETRAWVESAVAPLRPLPPVACEPGEALLKRIDAALASAPPAPVGGAPAGWKLVPEEPTDDMWRAASEAHVPHKDNYSAIYCAMLASAPPAPTPEAGASPNDGIMEGLRDALAFADGDESRATLFEIVPDLGSAVATAVMGRPWAMVQPSGDGEADADQQSHRYGEVQEIVASALADFSSPPPVEDLAGQGEPVAWMWDEDSGGELRMHASYTKPKPSERRRNIRPLYAAPAPSRPADREEIASAVAATIMGMDWAQVRSHGFMEGDADEEDRRHGMVQEAVLFALRDAPRDGGDWWSTDMEAAPKDGSEILLYGKLRRSTHADWYIGKWWQGGDVGFWAAHSVEVAATRWARLPPSPNPKDGTQEDPKPQYAGATAAPMRTTTMLEPNGLHRPTWDAAVKRCAAYLLDEHITGTARLKVDDAPKWVPFPDA